MPFISNALQPDLNVLSVFPSVRNLGTKMVINGLEGTNVCIYNGKDATATIINPYQGIGKPMPIVSVATPPTPDYGSPLLGDVDGGIKGNASDYYKYTIDTAYTDMTTEDLAETLIFISPADISSNKIFLAKGNNYITINTVPRILRYFAGVGGTLSAWFIDSVEPNTLYVVNTFLDASESTNQNGFQIWINRLNNTNWGGTAGNPAAMGSITNASNFALLASSSGGSPTDGSLIYYHRAIRSNWFAGGATNLTQWEAYHKSVYDTVLGFKHKSTTLYSYSRTTSAFSSKKTPNGVVSYFRTGVNHPRIVNVAGAFTGIRIEESTTNTSKYNEDFASWAFTSNITSITSDDPTKPTPYKGKFFDGIVSNNTVGTHYIGQQLTTNPTAQRYVYHGLFLIGNNPWICMSFYSATLGSVRAWYNLTTGLTGGTTGGLGADRGAIPLGNGIVFAWMSPLDNLVNEVTSVYVWAANADLDNTWGGGDGVTVNFWGACTQVEPGIYPTSYTGLVSTADVTRATDSPIIYTYSNALGQGSKVCKFYREVPPTASKTIWQITDGGSANERVYSYVDSSGYLNAEVLVGGASKGTVQIAQNVCNKDPWILGARWTDATLHILAYNMRTATMYTNSTALTGFPTGLDENNIVYPCGAVIGECKDYHYYEADNRRLLFG
jgi:hypothetical protein